MAETLNVISIVLFVIGCIFLILSVIYFIKYKIHNVINILSGRNAKKAIAKMNSSAGVKSSVTKKQKVEKATEILDNNANVECGETEILYNNINKDSGETEILDRNENIDSGATELLGDMPTEILQ